MSHDDCPTCRLPYIVQCRCLLSHRSCANMHEWHRCPNCFATTTDPASHDGDTLKNLCSDCRSAVTRNEEGGR